MPIDSTRGAVLSRATLQDSQTNAWNFVSIFVHSGASDAVSPARTFQEPLWATGAPIRGMLYVTARGQKIFNTGASKATLYKNEGQTYGMSFQIATTNHVPTCDDEARPQPVWTVLVTYRTFRDLKLSSTPCSQGQAAPSLVCLRSSATSVTNQQDIVFNTHRRG